MGAVKQSGEVRCLDEEGAVAFDDCGIVAALIAARFADFARLAAGVVIYIDFKSSCS